MTSIAIGISPIFGGQGFSPQAISDLIAWYDAAKGITLNGADVSNWADQSGNGNDVPQATALDQPLFNASDSGLNNQPSLGFDGIREFMRLATWAGGTLTPPNFVFIVFIMNDRTGSQYPFDSGTGAGNRHGLNAAAAGMNMFSPTERSINVNTDTDAHVLGLLYNDTSSDSFLDGVQGTPGLSPGTDNFNGVTLGSLIAGTGGFANVNIAEFAVYDKELSDTEKNLWGNYAAAKYGTTWTDI